MPEKLDTSILVYSYTPAYNDYINSIVSCVTDVRWNKKREAFDIYFDQRPHFRSGSHGVIQCKPGDFVMNNSDFVLAYPDLCCCQAESADPLKHETWCLYYKHRAVEMYE